MHAIALIGAGRIGRIHAANIAAHSRLRLLHVVDRDVDAAASLAERHGARSADADAAINDPEVAGIIVASATDTHIAYTIAAAEAGKPVLCEKPLDQSLAAAVAAADRLDALGARVLLGFNRRFDPHFAALRARLAGGAVGALESLHIVSHDPAPPPPAYVAGSGGMFTDMVIHDFDMARWLLDEEPVGVFASASCLIDPAIGAAGDVDTARTVLRTASGRLCSISSSRRSGYGYDQRIEAFGARGMLRVGNVAETMVETWHEEGATRDRLQNFFLDRYAAAYRAELDHFAEVIAGAAPAITHRDGVAALALAAAATRSLHIGRMETP
ncbi:inositol 2-dehydrogenase [Sphingomonas hengshuiensis]|uniref:Myo-inositol 2-dehydrogenase n=1 Tax=Sphingomonas hengshuiensis TaxID=1609977 RepID=A0A7U4J7P3_9SPHN|nr:inositol 2-dehydrogenase [Sphingomonas hengshuiensis]AJP71785.1 myo-inositol 2-dehydrogenase [Sphingomonas hengshuiensis]